MPDTEHNNRTDLHMSGDIVRVLRGEHAGVKGQVVQASIRASGTWILVSAPPDEPVWIPEQDLTNRSRAARRAWKSIPKRAVGRPPISESRRKKMVSMRLDQELLDDLQQVKELGLADSKEEVVSAALRPVLAELLSGSGGHSDVIVDAVEGTLASGVKSAGEPLSLSTKRLLDIVDAALREELGQGSPIYKGILSKVMAYLNSDSQP